MASTHQEELPLNDNSILEEEEDDQFDHYFKEYLEAREPGKALKKEAPEEDSEDSSEVVTEAYEETEEPTKVAPEASFEEAPPTEDPYEVESFKEPSREEILKELKGRQRELQRLEKSFEDTYGPLETPAERKAREEALEAVRQVKEDFAEVDKTLDYRLKDYDKTIREDIESVMADYRAEVAREMHNTLLQLQHPDVEEFFPGGAKRKDLDTWIALQPHKDASKYEQIRDAGESIEVIKLLDKYKESQNNRKKGAGSKTVAHEAEAIPTQRGLEPQLGSSEPDPDDFEGAFKEAAAMLAAKRRARGR